LAHDETDHNSYFTKLNFGSKEKFKSMHNYTLPLVVLTWLRQLQQFFFAQKERDTKKGIGTIMESIGGLHH
jgi:hypothetical protein